jgi:solute carrier family 25 S-adenosylmethionine transporter 26|eukprot:scaffold168_cov220-Chaetoceros_neogracile.AAC.6
MAHKERETPFFISLVSGGLAGTSVDLTLYPIDTLKTRLQSPKGFLGAGGFRGIYNGIGAAAIGSAPGAALFFSTYEFLKVRVNSLGIGDPAIGHCVAASFGEAAACLVRVPTEVLKQNMQIGDGKYGVVETFRRIVAQKESNAFMSSVLGGLYRGYGITLMREVPFAFIQFPMYERMKIKWSEYLGHEVTSYQAALCGSISGGIAAALTTPLDVIKTRLMIGQDKNGIAYKNAIDVGRRIIKEEGRRTFLSGIEPRVMWISIGGFIFFGAYEEYRSFSMSACGYQQ